MEFHAVTPSPAVKDFDSSVAWYSAFLDREPDRQPTEGTAEWDLSGEAGLQVSTSTETPVATVILAVADVDGTVQTLGDRAVVSGTAPFTVPSGQFRLCTFRGPGC